MTYGHAVVGPMGNVYFQRKFGYNSTSRGSGGSRRRFRGGRRRYRRRRIGRALRSVQPYTLTRNLKSVAHFNVDAGAGTIYVNTVNLNSAFDPTGVIGSGQPLGFDQYTALYQRCAVVKWSVKLEVCSTDNTNPIMIGFTPLVTSTGLSTYDHYKELPGTVSTILTPDVDKSKLFAKGGVKRYFLPPSARLMSDDTVTHGVGGNPSRILYGHIWVQSMDEASDPSNVRVIATIWQTVVFYVPEIPSRS